MQGSEIKVALITKPTLFKCVEWVFYLGFLNSSSSLDDEGELTYCLYQSNKMTSIFESPALTNSLNRFTSANPSGWR